MYKLIRESNNEKMPSEIILKLKPKISSRLSKKFCYKLPSKTDNIKDISEDISVIFSPNIQSAVEIPYSEVKKDDVYLPKSVEHYRFFVFPMNHDGKEYLVTYAEENKYSKREVIEILHEKNEISKDILIPELKNKYYFN